MNKLIDIFEEDIDGAPPPESNEEIIDDLRQRVEQLEIQNDTAQFNLKILEQILAIISEFPVGKQIVNRAINRQKLNYLVDCVLPRRQHALEEINHDETMPKGIRKSFKDRETTLLVNTKRAIDKRQRFEMTAARNVSTFFDKINDFFKYNRRPVKKMVVVKK